ncbi:MAG: TIGR03960 family B12-binding radical SAM protein [Desulfomonilaceae bacterium]
MNQTIQNSRDEEPCGPHAAPCIERLLRVQKPGRYIGKEFNAILKDPGACEFHMALAFPDVYEIGMSHLGLKILYSIVNSRPGMYAERVFAPWPDMEQALREQGQPLVTLETGTPLGNLDVVGFSLQYELCAATVLQMLDLGGIPLRSRDRSDGNPLVIAGGPVAFNPTPMSPFIDAFVIGDGEEAILEIAQEYIQWKRSRETRQELLSRFKTISGIYVPALHEPGEIVRKRIVVDLDQAPFPTNAPVPFCETVHDRIGMEIARGCTRGCRFCQAGMVYRPVRERSARSIIDLVLQSLRETGYDEVALLSLSSGDYSHICDVIRTLNAELAPRKTATSLPSLRTDTFDSQMAAEIRKVRKTGFTLAPEAGAERLRRIINKGNTEADLERALTQAFEYGWQSVKLYFMIGLPWETDEDIEAIANLARKAVKIAGGKKITVSVSSFVPKAHTPFQWAEQIDIPEIRRRQASLRRALSKARVTVKFHAPEMSFLEGLLARGDARMSDVIETAYKNGARFDGWDDQLRLPLWLEAMERHGLDPHSYLRARGLDEALPWDFVDIGVSKAFLSEEWLRALREEATEDCRHGQCAGCGICDFEKIYPRLGQALTRECVEESPRDAASEHHASQRRFRLQYGKKGPMSLLGHHDIERAFHRAFRRVGLNLAYSQGFHPHPRMRFSPPTGLGIESECEFVDFDLVGYEEESGRLLETLKSALPEGIYPVSLVETPLNEPPFSAKLQYVTYQIVAQDHVSLDALEAGVREFHESTSFVMSDVRKGKRRSRDLKTWIARLERRDNTLEMVLKTSPAGSVNPREAARTILGLTPAQALSLKITKTAVSVEPRLGGQ